VATYRVAFDGKWQEDFEDLGSAVEWAQQVGETGRIVHVVSRNGLSLELVAVFPESHAEEGKRLWDKRGAGSSSGGGG
jgi:hypothetical protein